MSGFWKQMHIISDILFIQQVKTIIFSVINATTVQKKQAGHIAPLWEKWIRKRNMSRICFQRAHSQKTCLAVSGASLHKGQIGSASRPAIWRRHAWSTGPVKKCLKFWLSIRFRWTKYWERVDLTSILPKRPVQSFLLLEAFLRRNCLYEFLIRCLSWPKGVSME